MPGLGVVTGYGASSNDEATILNEFSASSTAPAGELRDPPPVTSRSAPMNEHTIATAKALFLESLPDGSEIAFRTYLESSQNPTIFNASKYNEYLREFGRGPGVAFEPPGELDVEERRAFREKWKRVAKGYKLDRGVLMKRKGSSNEFKRVAMVSDAFGIIASQHLSTSQDSDKHYSISETIARVAGASHGIKHADTRFLVLLCLKCKRLPRQKSPPGNTDLNVRRPFKHLFIDYVNLTRISSNGYDFLLIIRDVFSSFVRLHALRAIDPRRICDFLHKYISQFGAPHLIQHFGNPLLDTAVALVGKETGLRLELSSLVSIADAKRAECMQRVVKFKIIAWRRIYKRTQWDSHLLTVARSINLDPNYDFPRLNANKIALGPRRAFFIKKSHELTDRSLGKTRFIDMMSEPDIDVDLTSRSEASVGSLPHSIETALSPFTPTSERIIPEQGQNRHEIAKHFSEFAPLYDQAFKYQGAKRQKVYGKYSIGGERGPGAFSSQIKS